MKMTLAEVKAFAKSGEGRDGVVYKEGIDEQFTTALKNANDIGAEVFAIYYLVDTTQDITRPSFSIENTFFDKNGEPMNKEEARAILHGKNV
jgi:hypothetical protein